jgi:hypothetical protein
MPICLPHIGNTYRPRLKVIQVDKVIVSELERIVLRLGATKDIEDTSKSLYNSFKFISPGELVCRCQCHGSCLQVADRQ